MTQPPEILLIDDDAIASSLRKRVLERHGYRVQLALDTNTGITLAAALQPALIVMDHHLPSITGPELYRRLHDALPGTPVISHSGYGNIAEQYDPIPDAFLTKGDGVERMLSTISALLDKTTNRA